jgi:hypothetical protein
MGDPRRLRPDEVEIVLARELRKAGVPLSTLRVTARRALSRDDADAYAMELAGSTSSDGTSGAARGEARREVVVELRNESRLADANDVQALGARTARGADADGPKRLQPAPPAPASQTATRPLRVLVSTTGFAPAAAMEARALGVVLLRIADGGAAFLRSQWAMGDQPPAWVPEYMAELADLGPADDVRYELITGPVTALANALASPAT